MENSPSLPYISVTATVRIDPCRARTSVRVRRKSMTGKPYRVPDANHPINVTPFAGRVVVRVGGKVIADSRQALSLKEAAYPTVLYVPREDADMSLLTRSAHATHCPYKGEASYFDLPIGENGRNGVWSYEEPHEAVAAIVGHLAFYPNKVEIETTA
jgi:uncharacterized protein (DUF427 family)